AEGAECDADSPERLFGIAPRRDCRNEPTKIWHLFTPHSGAGVITGRGMNLAAVREKGRRCDAVEWRQAPFSAPVEIHRRELAGQPDVGLNNAALLLLERVGSADAVRHEHQDVWRHDLCAHAVLRLVVGKAYRHA